MTSQSPQLQDDVSALVRSLNAFSCDLFRKLAREEEGNLFLAPANLGTALAMAYAGAAGETAREMSDVLHCPLPPEQYHAAFRGLREATKTDGVELHTANRLWGQASFSFVPEFLSTMREDYAAPLEILDFIEEPEISRKWINSWVAEQTADQIQDLLAEDDIDTTTRLVLTTAVHFLGKWTLPFDESATRDAPFWTGPSSQSTAEMMSQTADFQYGDFEDLQVLELPYGLPEDRKDGDFTMCILLPKRNDGLPEIEAKLTPDALDRWTRLRFEEVAVSIPKFRMESRFQLNKTLAKLGMPKAFSIKEADFSAMTDDPLGLFIAKTIHKAYVEVDEQGTEAAAATAVVMAIRGLPRTMAFRADRPFLFLIRDRNTNLVNFLGRVTDPQAAD